MTSIVVGFLVLGGAILFVIAAVGVVRLPDTYSRMHAASKASSLAIGLILIGSAWHVAETIVFIKAIATILFVFLTTPVAAHALSRAARLSGAKIWEATKVDELGPYYSKFEKLDTSRLSHSQNSNGDFAIHFGDVNQEQDPPAHR